MVNCPTQANRLFEWATSQALSLLGRTPLQLKIQLPLKPRQGLSGACGQISCTFILTEAHGNNGLAMHKPSSRKE